MSNLFTALVVALGVVAAVSLPAAESLQLLVRDSFMPGIPVLVRVDALDAEGDLDRQLWDGVVALTSASEGVTISPGEVVIRNGRGSALVTVEGDGDWELVATLDGLEARRSLRTLAGEPVTEVTGDLPGGDVEWSGVIHVTGDVNIRGGTTLRVLAGTLVLIDGVPSGDGGSDIDVEGAIETLGTAKSPVTL